jgi:hypothetical protein
MRWMHGDQELRRCVPPASQSGTEVTRRAAASWSPGQPATSVELEHHGFLAASETMADQLMSSRN